MTINQLSNHTVLITGGAGFIGSHLAKRLAQDNEVRIIDSLTTGERSNVPSGVGFVEGDVRNEALLTRVVEDANVIFHEAALVSVQRSIQTPLESHDINIEPLLTILEAARGTEKRVVFASSAAIYGDPSYVPLDEAHPKRPASPYGLEKLTADHYCRLYHELFDVETVSLRYFNAYGPGQQSGDYSGVVSIFRERALNDEPILIHGDGTQTRDFVYVDDIVRANVHAATTEKAVGTAFNIGTGTEVSIRELAEEIRDIAGSESEIRHVKRRDGDISESVADISLAKDVLGYDPEYDIRKGLNRYLEELTATAIRE